MYSLQLLKSTFHSVGQFSTFQQGGFWGIFKSNELIFNIFNLNYRHIQISMQVKLSLRHFIIAASQQ